MSNEMDATEQEFNDADGSRWGWDGYHTEDAARFARHFRGQRDEVRSLLIAAEAEVTRLREALERIAEDDELASHIADAALYQRYRGNAVKCLRRWTSNLSGMKVGPCQLAQGHSGDCSLTPTLSDEPR